MTAKNKPLSKSDLQGPARDFANFCEAEFERRRNSDSPFDETSNHEAMELVLRKLVGTKE